MPMMLRQTTTGDMYVYTELMARRDDMELVDIPDIAPLPAPEPVKPKKAAPKAKVEVKPDAAPVPTSTSFLESIFPE